MKIYKIITAVMGLVLLVSLSACSETASFTSETSATTAVPHEQALSEQIKALESELAELQTDLSNEKARNASLEAELDSRNSQIVSLQNELDQARASFVDWKILNRMEYIFESMAANSGSIELFSADLEEARAEYDDGKLHLVFNVIRHRPGWGWEITMDEEKEGFPVKARLVGSPELIFNYHIYDKYPNDLINDLKKSPGRINILMVDDRVVFIVDEKGP